MNNIQFILSVVVSVFIELSYWLTFKLRTVLASLYEVSLPAGGTKCNLPVLFLLTGRFLGFCPIKVKFGREERPCQISP